MTSEVQFKIGSKLPTFTLKDANDNVITDADLRGKISVIFFYPKDNTPGCTKEACDFRDHIDQFLDKGISLYGVSPDNATSHQKFIKKHSLNYTLLVDEDRSLANAFGVCKERNLFGIKRLTIERSTFIVDKAGTIIWMEQRVKVLGHVERILSALQILVHP
ncbi:MAG: peroxiredoxin [Chlamydiales bacterium]|nr:peroxiredoxin [Chlamydiales bacterium]